MQLLRSFSLAAALFAASALVAQDDSKPVLMSTTGANTWSDVNELKKAVDAGKPDALTAYGEMLLMGDQVTKDVPQAITLLEKAAQAGHKNAAFRLGKIYEDGEAVPRDAQKAIDFYRKAALGGVAEAQYNLGAMYVSARGIRRDYKEGLAWLIVATKNGAAGEGEKQTRDRLNATNRANIIPAAEQRAAELETEIKHAATNAPATGKTAK